MKDKKTKIISKLESSKGLHISSQASDPAASTCMAGELWSSSLKSLVSVLANDLQDDACDDVDFLPR